MLVAVLVMNSYNATVTRKNISLGNILLLICVAVSNGFTCVFEKFFAHYTARAKLNCDVSLFSLITFAFDNCQKTCFRKLVKTRTIKQVKVLDIAGMY